jgi:hypothetical protein
MPMVVLFPAPLWPSNPKIDAAFGTWRSRAFHGDPSRKDLGELSEGDHAWVGKQGGCHGHRDSVSRVKKVFTAPSA